MAADQRADYGRQGRQLGGQVPASQRPRQTAILYNRTPDLKWTALVESVHFFYPFDAYNADCELSLVKRVKKCYTLCDITMESGDNSGAETVACFIAEACADADDAPVVGLPPAFCTGAM